MIRLVCDLYSIHSTIHIVTCIYQYMSSSCYCIIHLLSLFCSYFTLIYKKYIILLYSICNHHRTLIISKIANQFIVVLLNTIFLCSEAYTQPTKSVNHQHIANIERPNLNRGLPIVVRKLWLWYESQGFSDS